MGFNSRIFLFELIRLYPEFNFAPVWKFGFCDWGVFRDSRLTGQISLFSVVGASLPRGAVGHVLGVRLASGGNVSNVEVPESVEDRID